jgi:hypothetical protein
MDAPISVKVGMVKKFDKWSKERIIFKWENTCLCCGKKFLPKRKDAKTCGGKCRVKLCRQTKDK